MTYIVLEKNNGETYQWQGVAVKLENDFTPRLTITQADGYEFTIEIGYNDTLLISEEME